MRSPRLGERETRGEQEIEERRKREEGNKRRLRKESE